VQKARLHNLKNIEARIPLGRLVAVTGVSGSGQIHSGARRVVESLWREPPSAAKAVNGAKGFSSARSSTVPDRRTPVLPPPVGLGRSGLSPTPREARMRGGGAASRFLVSHERRALRRVAEVRERRRSPCPFCGREGVSGKPARRALQRDTLAVKPARQVPSEYWRWNVDEAAGFFSAQRLDHRCLQLLQDVGLGYLNARPAEPTLVRRGGAANQAGDRTLQEK